MKQWHEYLFEFLAGLLARPKGSSGEVVTTVMDLGSGYSADHEESIKRQLVVDFALRQMGKPYVWATEVGSKPGEARGWDCSELVEVAYREAGMMMPDGSWNQKAYCHRVASPNPGDIGVLKPNAKGIGHVMIADGCGNVIHAISPRGVVQDPQGMWTTHARWDGWYRHPEFKCLPGSRL